MAGIVLLVVGSLMVLTALRSWRHDRFGARGDHPHCAACAYDLSGVAGGACPECGADLLAPCGVHRGMPVADPLAMVGCSVLGGVGGLLVLMGALALAAGAG